MRHALSFAALWLTSTAAIAGPSPIEVAVPSRKEPVSYALEVADILGAKCVGCHGAALAENKLNIEDVATMLEGGKRGPALVPGKAEASLIFQMAAHRVEPVMPPKDKKDAKPLTPEELGLLKLWIDAGAKDDSAENAEPEKPIELGVLPPGIQPVVAVDMTADGARFAAGRANVVQVYDADSGLEIVTLGGHKDIIQSIRFSPDGKRLAAGSYEYVTLWKVPTGGLAKTFAGHGDAVKALAVAADGKTAYSGGLDKSIRVWNLPDGKETRRIDLAATVLALSLAPDGQRLAIGGSDHIVRILNVADGKEQFALKGHMGPIQDVAFLPGGRRIASVSDDGTGRIWALPAAADATPPDPIVLTGHTGSARAIAISPDGQTVATGGDDATVRLWHAIDGKAMRSIAGHSGPVLSLAFSPKGDLLLTGSGDKIARLVDPASGEVIKTLTGHLGAVQSVAFAPEGDRVVSAGAEGGLKVWDVDSGRGVIAFGHVAPDKGPIQPIRKVAFTDRGVLLSASADKTLKSWTFEGSWGELKPLGPHVFRVLAIDFSPDGMLVATGGGEPSRSGEVKVWEVGKGMLVRSFDSLHSDTVFGLRFSPDGTKLASVAADKFLKVSQLVGGKELRSFEGHTHHVLAVDWKSDGKQLVTGGADNVLKVWDFDSGEQLRTLQAAAKQVTAVRWLPGKPQVVGASGDKLVRFWNADNGGIERSFAGPSDFVFGVAASNDGAKVVAGGADSVLFLWNGTNGQVLRKLEPRESSPSARTASVKP